MNYARKHIEDEIERIQKMVEAEEYSSQKARESVAIADDNMRLGADRIAELQAVLELMDRTSDDLRWNIEVEG